MTSSGATIDAAIYAIACTLPLVAVSARIVIRYPDDRGIRFGCVTLIAFLCTMAADRVPPLGEIVEKMWPFLSFVFLALACATIYFLVRETFADIKKSRARKSATYRQ
jgi:hypothetical protein